MSRGRLKASTKLAMTNGVDGHLPPNEGVRVLSHLDTLYDLFNSHAKRTV